MAEISKASEEKIINMKCKDRFYICGEVLEAADLKTLESGIWLNDKVSNKE